jgi:fibronectin-binding autotransporter adhesin
MNRTTPSTSSHGRAFAAVFSSGILIAASSLQAADQTYDDTNVSNVWDLSTLNWDGSAAAWTNGNNAIFGGTGESVAINAALTVGNITFNSTGYTIAPGTGSLTLAAGTDAISVGTANTATISAILGGTGALNKIGAGTLVLSGVNTFSGGLTISDGVVSVTANNFLGGTTGTAGTITLDGGTLRIAAPTGTITNTHVITVGANGGTINSQNGTGTYILGATNNLAGSGALTVSGTGSLVTTGAGVVVFGNSNTYNGVVTIKDGGIVEYANAGGVAAGGSFVVGNNGNLSVVTGVTSARDVTLNAGSTLSFQNGNAGILSGNITLAGNTTIGLRDWYNYGTVRSGTISSTITGAYTISVNSGTTLGTGGTLTLGGFDAKASSADLILNGASLALNSGSGTAAASVTRGNSLTINTGNLNVTGVASQNTNDVFGTLNLGNGSSGNLQGYSTWTLTPNAATNTALTFTNMGTRTSGSWVALASTVGATPAANTANIYFPNGLSGSNLVGSGGTLSSGTASVIPWLHDTGGANIYGYDATNGVGAITTVNVNPDSATTGQNINWNAASTLTGDRTINSLQMGFSGINLGGYTLTVSSGVITADNASFSNGTLNFGTAEGQIQVHQARQLAINSAITGSGGLTAIGFRTNSGNKGTLILNGANTFTGVTNIYGYGAGNNFVLYLTNSLALQNSTLNYVAGRAADISFGNGGTSGQTAYTFGGLSGNANINLNNNNTTVGTVALTVGGNNDSTTYSGILSSTVAGGSLTKTGAGTLTLSGTNTFTGATTVSNGTLALATSGSLASTSYVIGNGGIFNASAKSSYSLASVATAMDVGATAAGYFNAGSAALTLGNSLTLNFTTSLISDGQTYNLFDFGSQTGDFSSIALTGSIVGTLSKTGTDLWTGSDSLAAYNFTFNEATGSLLVNVTAVPEPATYVAIFAALALAGATLRRRRQV